MTERDRKGENTDEDAEKNRGTTEEGIDYQAEGSAPPDEEERTDSTDRGYDEAAHSGDSRFGRNEGDGGVFGTTGGGTYEEGMHVDKESER